ncbi:MAG: sugar phosphate isomerase/epimerase [Oscillospiraceae bacterium]|nr:sugar phosphate isomerase/epimerase [Oscillospiraceae bacterium]
MHKPHIYAFADEASSKIDGQIAAMKRNGLDGLEIRTVDGVNISDITLEKAKEVRKKLDDSGLIVWSLGSPIGKIGLDKAEFEAHLDKFKHTLELGDILGAKNIRMFSFYIPKDKLAENYRGEVFDRMGRLIETAKGSGIALCHENEKGIYGDIASRCLELHETFPELKAVFDPANFIQCGQETLEAWEMLKPYVYYLHIKDALANGMVVPAGKGIGHLGEILSDYLSVPGKSVTVEPHLKVFAGFANLEQGDAKLDDYSYPTNDAAFDAACNALIEIIN